MKLNKGENQYEVKLKLLLDYSASRKKFRSTVKKNIQSNIYKNVKKKIEKNMGDKFKRQQRRSRESSKKESQRDPGSYLPAPIPLSDLGLSGRCLSSPSSSSTLRLKLNKMLD